MLKFLIWSFVFLNDILTVKITMTPLTNFIIFLFCEVCQSCTSLLGKGNIVTAANMV